MTTPSKNRRLSLSAIALGLVAPHTWAQTRSPTLSQERPLIEVWKDPQCGCCQDWITHLESQNFKVKTYETGNTNARKRLGMPARLGSCHTGKVQAYVIEGHVPAAQIHRLLKERPVALGLAVPGMPVGSPGMDGPAYGGRRDTYSVLLVQKDGSTTIFSTET